MSEHVEVLRGLRARAAEWDDDTVNVAALDAAIAALSAPQPPSGGEVRCPECYGEGGRRWYEADGSERGERCGTCDGFGHVTAPPSAPVGVEGWNPKLPPLIGTLAALTDYEKPVVEAYGRGGARAGRDATLAQQPAAVDGETVSRIVDAIASHPMNETDTDTLRRCVTEALHPTAAQRGGSDNDR